MKKLLALLGFMTTAFVSMSVPVTINVSGGLVRSYYVEDPSTCARIYTYECRTDATTCFIITYDNGLADIGLDGNNLFAEGSQDPQHPVSIGILGETTVHGLCANYSEFNSVDPIEGIVRNYQFSICEAP